MRKPYGLRGAKDRGVSEVIGYVLVFAIITSIVTTAIMVYVPDAGRNNERAYQTGTLEAMQGLESNVLKNSGSPGYQISQIMPTGIQGAFLTQTTPTTVGYSVSSASFSLSYSLSVGIQVQGYNPGTNLSYSKVIRNISIGANTGPVGMVIGPYDFLYVINDNANSISVINPSTNTYLGSIHLLNTPFAIAYDSGDNTLLLSTSGGFLQKISVSISGTVVSSTLLLHTQTQRTLYDLIYDPSTGAVIVGTEPGGVGVYNASTFNTIEFFSIRQDPNTIPSSFTYDPANGIIYVAGGSYVWALNSVTYALSNLYSVYSPWSIAFDSYNGNIYASADTPTGNGLVPDNTYYRSVYIYNATTGGFVTQATMSHSPTDIVYDPANRYVYVANYYSNQVAVFNGMEPNLTRPIQNLPVPAGPGAGFSSIIYDPTTGNVYVADYLAGEVSVIQGNAFLGSGWEISDTGMALQSIYNGSGTLYTSGSTTFVTPQSYSLEDGAVIASDSSGNGVNDGPLPVIFNLTSGTTGVTMNTMSLTGKSNFSYSNTGNIQTHLTLVNRTVNTLSAGQVVHMYNKNTLTSLTAEILTVKLSSFSFKITSPLYKAWDYAFYSTYNSTNRSESTVDGYTTWSFAGFPIQASVDSATQTLQLVESQSISLGSVTVGSYTYGVQIIY